MVDKSAYFDNAATTKVYSVVAAKVDEASTVSFANPSSSHSAGKKVKELVESARVSVASRLNTSSDKVMFTSGGTESANLVLRGLVKRFPDKKHILCSSIEHPCVLETCKELEQEGFRVDYLSVDEGGFVSVDEIKSKLSDDTLVVCVMHVNNEVGTVQPIADIAKVTKEKGVLLFSDAVQSFGKLPVDVELLGVDFLSFSAHKFGGPKGVGGLFVKDKSLLSPTITGGGQEFGLRSGTLNVPGILGLAAALDVSHSDPVPLRDRVLERLQGLSGVRINSSVSSGSPFLVHLSFYGIDSTALLDRLSDEGFFVSVGSACASTRLSTSHVLEAMGLEELFLHGSLRISFFDNSLDEVDLFLDRLLFHVGELRALSPFEIKDGGV